MLQGVTDPYQVHADATPVLSRASSTPRLSSLPGHTITLESAGALTATPIFSLSVSGHSEWKQTQAPRVPDTGVVEGENEPLGT